MDGIASRPIAASHYPERTIFLGIMPPGGTAHAARQRHFGRAGFSTGPGRVARLLLDNFPAGQDTAPRHLTLDQMAARVGTTREMV